MTRSADVTAHDHVGYLMLDAVPDLNGGDREAGNVLVQGDSLDGLKALLPFYKGWVCLWRKWGRSTQAIDRSRGGWAAKAHALTDVISRPYALMLTPLIVRDVKAAPALLDGTRRMRYLLGDKGYNSNRLRRLACDAGAGAIPFIRGRRNRKRHSL